MTEAQTLLNNSIDQHGFWLINHADIIIKDINKIIKNNGLTLSVNIINDIDNPLTKKLYKKIRKVLDETRN